MTTLSMDTIKSRLSVLDDHFPRGARVAYLDFPIHRNVGDLLIFHATEKYLADRDARIVARHSVLDTKGVPRLDPDVILAFHGGGNIGDIYPWHQAFRERVIPALKRHRAIILPQTVHFDNVENERRSLGVLASHPDLTVFARDMDSRKTLEQYGIRSIACPDMAHYLWPFEDRREDGHRAGTLRLVRSDVERHQCQTREAGDQDWDDLLTPTMVARAGLFFERFKEHLDEAGSARRFEEWLCFTGEVIDHVERILVRHQRVVTSRLHGYLLSCLLGIDARWIDNSYGKIGRYVSTWAG